MLKGITDDELKMLDEFEDVEYDRKAVEVVLTVITFWSEQLIPTSWIRFLLDQILI